MRESRHSLIAVALASACGSGGGFPDAAPSLGTYSLAWSVADTGGKLVTCDQIGATMVEATARPRGAGPAPTDNFTCSSSQGQSEELVPGTYDIGFTLASGSSNLATAPSQTATIVAGQNTALSAITFTIDATGNLSMTLAASGMAANCSGAKAITGTTIVIAQSTTGLCAKTAAGATLGLAIARGPTSGYPSGVYVVDCAPMTYGCIENDQVITSAAALVSGSYTVSVRGKIGGTACWAADFPLQIPALGASVTKSVALTYQTGAPGCP